MDRSRGRGSEGQKPFKADLMEGRGTNHRAISRVGLWSWWAGSAGKHRSHHNPHLDDIPACHQNSKTRSAERARNQLNQVGCWMEGEGDEHHHSPIRSSPLRSPPSSRISNLFPSCFAKMPFLLIHPPPPAQFCFFWKHCTYTPGLWFIDCYFVLRRREG